MGTKRYEALHAKSTVRPITATSPFLQRPTHLWWHTTGGLPSPVAHQSGKVLGLPLPAFSASLPARPGGGRERTLMQPTTGQMPEKAGGSACPHLAVTPLARGDPGGGEGEWASGWSRSGEVKHSACGAALLMWHKMFHSTLCPSLV